MQMLPPLQMHAHAQDCPLIHLSYFTLNLIREI
jgi:hypothetical protein